MGPHELECGAKRRLVDRRGQHHLGEAAQIGHVEEAVVYGAVAADQTGAIHAEPHGKLLQGDFLEDLVETTLDESRLDRCKRAKAGLGHARTHVDRMRLRDSDVECALGEPRDQFRDTRRR